jgi:hypothetical protein
MERLSWWNKNLMKKDVLSMQHPSIHGDAFMGVGFTLASFLKPFFTNLRRYRCDSRSSLLGETP